MVISFAQKKKRFQLILFISKTSFVFCKKSEKINYTFCLPFLQKMSYTPSSLFNLSTPTQFCSLHRDNLRILQNFE